MYYFKTLFSLQTGPKDRLPSAKTSKIQIDPFPVGARCEVIPKPIVEEPTPDEKLSKENAHLKQRMAQQVKDRDTLLQENKDLLSMLLKSREHIQVLEQERNWLSSKLEEQTQSTNVKVTRRIRKVSDTYLFLYFFILVSFLLKCLQLMRNIK